MKVAFQEVVDEFAALFGPGAILPQAAASATAVSAVPVAAGAPGVPPPPAPAPVAPPLPSVQRVDYAFKGYHLDVCVLPEQVVAAAKLLDAAWFCLEAVTGVDWLAEGQMEVVYDYFHPESHWRVVVRCRVPRELAEVPTVSRVFPGANWHERETHEFFGIGFTGHPNLIPLLLPEDATFHPLRKDFVA